MPIEIREVIIKTVVDPSAGGGGKGPANAGKKSGGNGKEQQLVDKILQIMEDKEER